MICYVPGDRAGDEQLGLLGLLGALVPIDEAAMDAATAVMSPAPIALVAEALARAGADAGLSGSLAHELVADTLAGTAELLRRRDPGAIRRAVASPGGATEAGLEALAERDLGGRRPRGGPGLIGGMRL